MFRVLRNKTAASDEQSGGEMNEPPWPVAPLRILGETLPDWPRSPGSVGRMAKKGKEVYGFTAKTFTLAA